MTLAETLATAIKCFTVQARGGGELIKNVVKITTPEFFFSVKFWLYYGNIVSNDSNSLKWYSLYKVVSKFTAKSLVVKVNDNGKHSSLLLYSNNNSNKMFYSTGPWGVTDTNVVKITT